MGTSVHDIRRRLGPDPSHNGSLCYHWARGDWDGPCGLLIAPNREAARWRRLQPCAGQTGGPDRAGSRGSDDVTALRPAIGKALSLMLAMTPRVERQDAPGGSFRRLGRCRTLGPAGVMTFAQAMITTKHRHEIYTISR